MRTANRSLTRGLGLAFLLAALAAPALAHDFEPTAAPELDPGSMAGALALLSGGLLIVSDRVRRR